MGKLIEYILQNKGTSSSGVILVIFMLVVGGAYADLPYLGAVRPVHAADFEPVKKQVRANANMIFQLREDQLIESIWKYEDRMKASPSPDVNNRLRELRLQLLRLRAEMGK